MYIHMMVITIPQAGKQSCQVELICSIYSLINAVDDSGRTSVCTHMHTLKLYEFTSVTHHSG